MTVQASIVAIIVLVGATNVALIGAAERYPSIVIAENGLLENLQLVVLLMTTIVLLSAAARQTDATRAAAIALAGASGAASAVVLFRTPHTLSMPSLDQSPPAAVGKVTAAVGARTLLANTFPVLPFLPNICSHMN